MTISKEIFGISRKEILENTGVLDSEYCYGFNDALDLIDQFELSEEELAKIIKEKLGCDTLCVGEAEYVAKAIIQNKSKIFVRKTK